MVAQILTLVTLALTSVVTATPYKLHQRANDVTVTQLDKSSNSTGGTADAAASGNLSPFGEIGLGCGLDWKRDVSYGGGLTAGSSDYGLGGGFVIAPENITVGLGIGINPANASADINFSGTKDGQFRMELSVTGKLTCVPGLKDGRNIITCQSGDTVDWPYPN
ncbi:hypothetical protein NX059_005241 [Plenodomus lindquistii]|nr:hypothetical protein NX059_005241 [Plenodomus lindquistii]